MLKSKIATAATDSELFGKIANLQRDALSELYDRYADRLFGLAYKILNHESLAEDVLQELFVYLWENAQKLDKKRGNVSAWLTVLCRNRCIDKLRNLSSTQRHTAAIDDAIFLNMSNDESANLPDILSYKETQVKVKLALQQLPAEQLQPIMMAYFEGCSQSEIASKTNQPLGTVKTKVCLGMQNLRTIFETELQP